MKKITVSEKIRQVCPLFIGAAVAADVTNSEYSAGLWKEITALDDHLSRRYTKDDIKQIASIAATREVYRALGKDPSRYRPSGEQLLRRVLQGKGLYQINTLVDLINLASMSSGYSIGAFDEEKIAGSEVILGVGCHDEPYQGIGRGALNIEGLPVYRDALGGIGTPTSDNERTKISLGTRKLLVFVNGFDGDGKSVTDTAELIRRLLRRYCLSDGGEIIIY